MSFTLERHIHWKLEKRNAALCRFSIDIWVAEKKYLSRWKSPLVESCLWVCVWICSLLFCIQTCFTLQSEKTLVTTFKWNCPHNQWFYSALNLTTGCSVSLFSSTFFIVLYNISIKETLYDQPCLFRLGVSAIVACIFSVNSHFQMRVFPMDVQLLNNWTCDMLLHSSWDIWIVSLCLRLRPSSMVSTTARCSLGLKSKRKYCIRELKVL